MQNYIDVKEYIQDLCEKKCFFKNLKENCVNRMTQEFSFMLLSCENLTTLIHVKLLRKFQSLCKIHENRFQIIYGEMVDLMLKKACSRYYPDRDSSQFLDAFSYAQVKIEKDIRAFNTQNPSPVFDELHKNILKIEKLHQEQKFSFELEKLSNEIFEWIEDSSSFETDGVYSQKDTKARVIYLTQKILNHYLKPQMSISSFVQNALIENALIQLEEERVRVYLEKKFFLYKKEKIERRVVSKENCSLEEELLLRCSGSKEEVSSLLYTLLLELMYREKFFQYIKVAIKNRVHDFPLLKKSYREKKKREDDEALSLTVNLKEKNTDASFEHLEYEFLDEEVKKILTLLNKKESVLLKLKAGYVLEKEEIFNLKLVLFHGVNIVSKSSEIFEQPRGRYLEKEEIFIKIIHAEPLKSKEIAFIFNKTEKQINRKLEYLRNKMKKRREKKYANI